MMKRREDLLKLPITKKFSYRFLCTALVVGVGVSCLYLSSPSPVSARKQLLDPCLQSGSCPLSQTSVRTGEGDTCWEARADAAAQALLEAKTNCNPSRYYVCNFHAINVESCTQVPSTGAWVGKVYGTYLCPESCSP